ncbi:MAG: hypothetical protein L6Q80_00685 [Dehalococcoidia bacterium]|nr:hypothetical protein [Dehalococcoidia bacterium]MCL4232797.1 hypothetical protein [Dehalococcoidia bacterium]
MSLSAIAWKLASPYDAYVSHVARLNEAVDRIRYFIDRALGYEAGLQSSIRMVPSAVAAGERAQRFRETLASSAASMTDEEFESFIADLGGGKVAEVEASRAQTVSRLTHTARGLEEYFAIAGRELATLERRGYNPHRPDVARQLEANRLPQTTVAEFRKELHQLGLKVGRPAGARG